MMMKPGTFKLNYVMDDGTTGHYQYDPHTSDLLDENGNDVLPRRIQGEADPFPMVPWPDYDNIPDALAISPEAPGIKHGRPRRLKIQLGLGCNYSCSYCLQATQIGQAAQTSTADANIFLKQLDKWLDGSGLEKIEIWGGEPFLYWHKIKVLVPALREKFPTAKFGTVTNGSLLTTEIIDQLAEWGFSMSISHDGPGQPNRGPDPFEGEEGVKFRDMILYAGRKLEGRISFLSVLTPQSPDPKATIDWLDNAMNFDWDRRVKYHERVCKNLEANNTYAIPPDPPVRHKVRCNFEGMVHDYNGDETSAFTEAELSQITFALQERLKEGLGVEVWGFKRALEEVMESLINRRPSRILGQNCQMDRPDELAVDLLGNIMTCQNVGAKGEHRLGHVMLLDKARLNTSWHWSSRAECSSCPVLQLCKGACMYQSGDNFVSTCNAEFAWNMAFLFEGIRLLTGANIYQLEGNAIRPRYSWDVPAVNPVVIVDG